MGLDCECGHWHAWDTRSWQLPSAAGCGVSTPAARAERGVSSGAALFGDVAGAARDLGPKLFDARSEAVNGL